MWISTWWNNKIKLVLFAIVALSGPDHCISHKFTKFWHMAHPQCRQRLLSMAPPLSWVKIQSWGINGCGNLQNGAKFSGSQARQSHWSTVSLPAASCKGWSCHGLQRGGHHSSVTAGGAQIQEDTPCICSLTGTCRWCCKAENSTGKINSLLPVRGWNYITPKEGLSEARIL